MGYTRRGNTVILEMSIDQFEQLLVTMGLAIGAIAEDIPFRYKLLRLANELNAGNPQFQPFEIPRGVRAVTRDEHLAWAKGRALAYLPGDPLEAMTSMMSDLTKHEELKNHIGLQIAPMFYGAHHDPEAVRRWIVGFN